MSKLRRLAHKTLWRVRRCRDYFALKVDRANKRLAVCSNCPHREGPRCGVTDDALKEIVVIRTAKCPDEKW